MALSGVAAQGLASRPVGRSISCGDLSSFPGLTKDGIQLYLTAPGKGTPVRMLASDAISSVNLKIRGASQGFYIKQNCKVLGPCTGDESLSHFRGSADRLHCAMGVSDLLHLSVSTVSGKEFTYPSELRSRFSCTAESRTIPEENLESEQWDAASQQMLAMVHHRAQPLSSPWDSFLEEESLRIVANSRVSLAQGRKGDCLELCVQAAPAIGASGTSLQWPCVPLLQDLSPIPAGLEVRLLAEVEEGLMSGHRPKLTAEGSGGTYFMENRLGQNVAVFKPMDEEPLAVNCPRGMVPSSTGEGLKKGTLVGEGAFREVSAYLLDHPHNGSSDGFSGVPLTILAHCSAAFFPKEAEDGGIFEPLLDGVVKRKTGSLQCFVPALSNCEDMGPQRFPVHEVHKVAVLDMRLGNTDRNGANILVQQDGSSLKLVPIDHGYILPESLEDLTFEWMFWPQARVPFDKEVLEYISSLDAEGDVLLLKRSGWDISDAAVRTLRACTLLLKVGASKGLSASEIGSLMVRMDFDHPSALEVMVEEAEARLDRDNLGPEAFTNLLACIISEKLAL